MKLLVSVRSVDEALLAAGGGADFIDLKEPDNGALGALPLPTIAAIVAALRAGHPDRPISATVGDIELPAAGLHGDPLPAVLSRAAATAACGVDYVKVGICGDPATALRLLDALAALDAAVVPVLIADHGVPAALVDAACALPFPAVMVDTADKRRGSLFDLADMATLRAVVKQVRAAGQLSGLAGALRVADAPRLALLGPDFAGFRSAVCDGARTGTLDVARLQALRMAVGSAAGAAVPHHRAA